MKKDPVIKYFESLSEKERQIFANGFIKAIMDIQNPNIEETFKEYKKFDKYVEAVSYK